MGYNGPDTGYNGQPYGSAPPPGAAYEPGYGAPPPAAAYNPADYGVNRGPTLPTETHDAYARDPYTPPPDLRPDEHRPGPSNVSDLDRAERGFPPGMSRA
jgi:hypothetical protein